MKEINFCLSLKVEIDFLFLPQTPKGAFGMFSLGVLGIKSKKIILTGRFSNFLKRDK